MNNIPALVKIMAWHRPGEKPLSESKMVSLLTHICIARPQWVKHHNYSLYHHCANLSEDIGCLWDIFVECVSKIKHTLSIINYTIYGAVCFQFTHLPCGDWRGGWGCEVSCGGHHRPRGKTTTGSALDEAVFDIAQILAYLVPNMSRSQLYLGFGHFGWLPSFFSQ